MASMMWELRVEMDGGGEFVVVADQRDAAKWEVQPFGWPLTQIVEKGGVTFFRFVGWSAATRAGKTALTWDKFGDACVSVTNITGDDEEEGIPADAADPGRPARSGTPSSRTRAKRASR